ncbi:MAG: helix-turn-helix transcriptional regulator [Bacteroides sp.]|nr:helix-turn-helix transcriptional regulator [Bacteroides sp.]
MNPFLTTKKESFKVGTDNLEYFLNRPTKMTNGVLTFSLSGEADVMIDLKQYHIVPYTNLSLLPGCIFSLIASSQDFEMHFFSFSEEMFQTVCFRLDPPFIHFLKENACHTHVQPETIRSVKGMIEASQSIYYDLENRFRETIAQNLLQIFFLDAYDKAQRLYTQEQIKGSSRKEELFKKFISLAHTYCTSQRDVSFYAERLCISPRYLSTITQRMGQKSAKEIIDDMLILELKVALQSTPFSLKELADRYHFPDQSFFGRYFKKHTGMSPKEFRAKER